MAATQYSDVYYNSTYQHYHHHQSQQQNVYGCTTGPYDCRNLNVNDAYHNYNYNSPNNYNDQWTQQYNVIANTHQHHQTQPHYHHQHLNMLNNQINDDYKNYSHPSYNNNAATSKPIGFPSDTQHHPSHTRNELQPNSHCRQYVDRKKDLYYGQQTSSLLSGSIAEATVSSYSTSQLTELPKEKKIESSTLSEDSPALRALLTKPSKHPKFSPYFYHSSQGSISPASSTDNNYPPYCQLPSVPVVAAVDDQLVNRNHYNHEAAKEGYETAIDVSDVQTKLTTLDGKFSAASLFSPSVATSSPMSSFMENISTPPTSPKDVNLESADNLSWIEQNGGL